MSEDTNELVEETTIEADEAEETNDEQGDEGQAIDLSTLKPDEQLKALLDKPEADWSTDDAALMKKLTKTLAIQKSQLSKKIGTKKLEPVETNKPNTNDSISRDEVVLLAQGVKPEVLEEAKLISVAKGISIPEAMEYPTVKAFSNELKQKEKSDKAQLGASSGGSSKSSNIPETYEGKEDEHKKLFEQYNK